MTIKETILSYYENFAVTRENFDVFHNNVINMPRESFTNLGLSKLKTICSYLYILKDEYEFEELNYKQILMLISQKLHEANTAIHHRSIDFENRYFNYSSTFDEHYEKEGRMFRHVMGECAFWGIITSITKQKKIINYDKCLEFILAKDAEYAPILRNNLLNINIKNNDFINSLHGIVINENADYRVAHAIVKYIKQINRPVTGFEIAILLGRIDELQSENEIMRRATTIGNLLPSKAEQQKKLFFEALSWTDNCGLYNYASSQQPDFKFNNYLVFMETFGLIRKTDNGNYLLTNYSEKLLAEDMPIEVVDLRNLIYSIDEDEEGYKKLKELVVVQRNTILIEAIERDPLLVKKLNMYSLNHPIIKNGKRQRNTIISEMAKILAQYNCQATGKPTFRTPNNKNYVEAHHILEFSTDSGPDITDNLVVLGPEKHILLHRANIEEINNITTHLISTGIYSFDRFKRMVVDYHCLTENHINRLYEKRIISSIHRDQLLELQAL